MLIKCEKCASPLQVPDSAAGKKVRCPKCQNVMVASVPVVPEVLPVAPVAAPPPPPPPPVEEPAALPAAKDEEPAEIDDDVDSEPHVTAARPKLSKRDDDDDDRPRPRRRKSRRAEPLPRGERSSEDLQAIIGYQRKILYCILIYVIVFVFAMFLVVATRDTPNFSSMELVFALVYFIYVAAVEYFVFNLAWRLYGPVIAIFLGILFAIPFLNFLVLVGMNSGATSVIRFHGISVGFMGADPSQAGPSRLYERRMLQREPVSDKKLFDRYFAEDDVFLDLPARVRRIFADFVGLPEKKMLPDDDLEDLLGRRRKDELFGELEHEFRIKFSDDEIDDTACTIRAVTLLVQDRLDEQG